MDSDASKVARVSSFRPEDPPAPTSVCHARPGSSRDASQAGPGIETFETRPNRDTRGERPSTRDERKRLAEQLDPRVEDEDVR